MFSVSSSFAIMSRKITLVAILFCFCNLSESARILAVFPIPSISHQVVFRPITHELVKRGHEVVVLTTDPAFSKGKAPKNLTEIDVHDLSYKLWHEFHATSSGNADDIFTQMKVGIGLVTKILEKQFSVEEFSKIVKYEHNKFDLLLLEAAVRPALALTHIFNAPTILISSFGAIYGNFEMVGAPIHPLLYPNTMAQKINNLTMWDKIKAISNDFRLQNVYAEHEDIENEMIKKNFGNDVPDLSELKKNVDMLFLNTHPVWDSNRPVPPNVIYMGGLHQNPKKDLPADLKSYLDSSKIGVIYISFGTNVSPSLLPPEKIKMFTEVFSQLPYDTLWKWDKDILPGQPKNVRIGKWFPQSDLLRHPKVKLFITQGGLQSTDEAITAGVPLLGVPLLGDQWYNVEMYIKKGIGRRLDMETLTKEQLKEALLILTGDGSYRKNIEDLRQVMYDQPTPPIDRAIWWIEYVLRHKGAKHLKSPAANISWYEYVEMPLVLVLLAITLTSASVISVILYSLYQLIYCNRKEKLKKY